MPNIIFAEAPIIVHIINGKSKDSIWAFGSSKPSLTLKVLFTFTKSLYMDKDDLSLKLALLCISLVLWPLYAKVTVKVTIFITRSIIFTIRRER